MRFLSATGPARKRRLLAVWDFRTAPPTVGEALVFQTKTQMLLAEKKLEKVDIAWLIDPRGAERNDPGTDAPDFHLVLARLLPLAQVNPHLGSFFLFDSADELAAFIAATADGYEIYPSARAVLGTYEYYRYYLNDTINFYAKHGYVPYLSVKPAMQRWARKTLAATMPDKIPVILHLRNGTVDTSRNARIDVWLEFVDYCSARHPEIGFMLISAREEVDDRFRTRPNVVISRDTADTVEGDLALVQESAMYLGTTSGPNIMPILSDRPYLIYNFRTNYEKIPAGSSLPYATSNQKLIWAVETFEQLESDFEDALERFDANAWRQRFGDDARIAAAV